MLLPVFVICTLRLLSHCSNKIHTIKTAQFLSFKTGCSYPRITVSSKTEKNFKTSRNLFGKNSKNHHAEKKGFYGYFDHTQKHQKLKVFLLFSHKSKILQ